MLGGLKRSWKSLADGTPGERFQQRYHHRRRRKHTRMSGVLTTLAGVGLIIVGAVLMVIPGPGIPFVALGAALVAQEFLWVARAADALERLGRRAVRWMAARWRGAPVGLRVVAATLATIIGTAAGYGAYRFVF